MKWRKIILIILAVLIIGLLILYLSRNRIHYNLKKIDKDKIVSINVEKDKNGLLISASQDIEKIYNSLFSEERTSHLKNKNLARNAIIIIKFYYESKEAGAYYLYENNDKYYLEDIYNVMYEITKQDYELVNSYLK